jgi:hypothetical protein
MFIGIFLVSLFVIPSFTPYFSPSIFLCSCENMVEPIFEIFMEFLLPVFCFLSRFPRQKFQFEISGSKDVEY